MLTIKPRTIIFFWFVCLSKSTVVLVNTWELINLFISYNIITNYILIIYELCNFDHVLGVVSPNSSRGN